MDGMHCSNIAPPFQHSIFGDLTQFLFDNAQRCFFSFLLYFQQNKQLKALCICFLWVFLHIFSKLNVVGGVLLFASTVPSCSGEAFTDPQKI